MNILRNVLHYASMVFTDIVYFISMYSLLISFFGIIRKKDNLQVKPKKTFAVIVAAHNEEAVIQDMVLSLKRLNYPKELYDIFVIADNCTDRTAQKAREKGAIVHERFVPEKKGKGYALEWMFSKLFNMKKKYDAVVLFDADNVVHKDFLMHMNKKLLSGYKVAQGYLDSKNPKDTWITGAYSIAFWTTDRMFQLARNNIGISCQLGGTGCVIDTDILRELGWGATCLTEDLEFTSKLVLNGYKVGWVHDAIVYDEKPLTMKQSWVQRKRWMRGFADVCSRYFFKLFGKAIKEFNFTALDCAIYILNPITTILMGISLLISVINYILLAQNYFTSASNFVIVAPNFTMIMIFAYIAGAFQFLYTPFILWLDKKIDWKVFWYYIIYPFYLVTWIPIALLGILNKGNKEWDHTKHTRNASAQDLEKAN